MSSQGPRHDVWTERLLLGALLSAVPLVLFGGSVTTLGAGMSVDGWLIAEGHFLLFFPLESWLRDTATFVEHTHRLFGVLVGLFTLLACGRAWTARPGRAALAPTLALLCVCAQGTLGGFRVLEQSSQLAFLHGVFAQATFAVLAVAALLASRRFAVDARTAAPVEGGWLVALTSAAALVVLAQVALGAWYRHGLRPAPVGGEGLRLVLHMIGAAVTLVVVALEAVLLRRAARRSDGLARRVLAGGARRLDVLLGVQVLLGLCAWAGYRPSAIGPLEWGLSIAHVLFGALLFAQCAALLAWTLRLTAPGARASSLALEGAR